MLPVYNGYPLGCTLPTTFPTMFSHSSQAFAAMTLDQIKAEIANRGGALWKYEWSRGQPNADSWIKDQGRHGSCNGWSTSAASEKTRVLVGLPHVPLSGADAYSQMNGGSDNGSALADGLKVCQNGIAPASMVGVDQIYTSQISAAAKAARAQYRGWEPFAADTQEEFATGIILGFIGIIAVDVHGSFDSLDSDGCPSSGNGPGNHSVHVDDLGLTKSGDIKFDSPNNWTVSWGDRGRCFYTWNKHLQETVRNHRFWLLRSTNDPSDGTQPPAAE